MNIPKTFSDLIKNAMSGKRVEPYKRVKCTDHVPRGKRNLPERPKHHSHRYEIIGGITMMDLMAENIVKNNALLTRLMKK